jgi:hypothetical protein
LRRWRRSNTPGDPVLSYLSGTLAYTRNQLGIEGELTADDALAFASATTLAAVIRVRRLSPAKATCGALDRINLAQPVLNSFITVAEDAVMTQAREAEVAMSGARRWVRRLACRSR